jgi:hypothetical protein
MMGDYAPVKMEEELELLSTFWGKAFNYIRARDCGIVPIKHLLPINSPDSSDPFSNLT